MSARSESSSREDSFQLTMVAASEDDREGDGRERRRGRGVRDGRILNVASTLRPQRHSHRRLGGCSRGPLTVSYAPTSVGGIVSINVGRVHGCHSNSIVGCDEHISMILSKAVQRAPEGLGDSSREP